MTDYVEDFAPGSGSRTAARSWLPTDAPSLVLNGEWQFRLHPSHRGLPGPSAADVYEETIPVPSHWVLGPDGVPAGGERGLPIYTNVQYPFPVDPPFIP
ncbi:MAG: sugar-binding domain-containing protein, partial [Friedmanniella sp.]